MFNEIQNAGRLLYEWKKNPKVTRRELNFTNYSKDRPENDRPFPRREIKAAKNFLLRHAPYVYYGIFMEKSLDSEINRTRVILQGWKENPSATKNEILGILGEDLPENNKPFSKKEIKVHKDFLLQNAPEGYYRMFMERSIFLEMIYTTEILERWNRNPNATKNEILDLWPHYTQKNDRPLSKQEIKDYKDFLRQYAPPCYRIKLKDEKKMNSDTKLIKELRINNI